MRVEEVPLQVPPVILRMLPRPVMIPARMIGDDIDDDLESKRVGILHQLRKIIQRTELRVDRRIIGTRIITAQTAQPFLYADRRDRHKPEDIDPHLPQPRHLPRKSRNSPFRSILPEIDLIDIGCIAPRYRMKCCAHSPPNITYLYHSL